MKKISTRLNCGLRRILTLVALILSIRCTRRMVGCRGLSATTTLGSRHFLDRMSTQMLQPYESARDSIVARIDARVDEADKKLQAAIEALGDGYDQGEIIALIDAQTSKWAAQISKNADDIAELTTTVVDDVVNTVTEGMNSVMQGAAGAAGQVADSFATAFNRMVNALTGKSLGKWHQEIYLAAMTVVDGANDIPLGVTAPFDGKIGYLRCRTEAFTPKDADVVGSAKISLYINGLLKWNATWDDNTLDKSWEMNVPLHAGNVIVIKFSNLTVDIQGLSVTLSGDYL